MGAGDESARAYTQHLTQMSDESTGDGTRLRGGKLLGRGPNSKYLRLWGGSHGLCLNNLILLLLQENSHKLYVSTLVWLCSHKALFTKTHSWQDLAPGQVYQVLS